MDDSAGADAEQAASPTTALYQHAHLYGTASPATPRKRRRSEENYYATFTGSLSQASDTPASMGEASTGTLRQQLLSPASIGSSSGSYSPASSLHHFDGLAPPLAKRPHPLHRTWTAPVSPSGAASSPPPPTPGAASASPTVIVVDSDPNTANLPLSAPTRARMSLSDLRRSSMDSGGHGNLPGRGVSALADDTEMSIGDGAPSRSPPQRLLSPAMVSPTQQASRFATAAAASSDSSAASGSTSPPSASASPLSTPWQRRFADSTSPLATSTSFPFARRATLAHQYTSAATSTSLGTGHQHPVFGVPAFGNVGIGSGLRSTSLSSPRFPHMATSTANGAGTRSLLDVPQHQVYRRTSTSSLSHHASVASSFGAAFARSLSAQDLTTATTAGLLLLPHPSHSSPLAAPPLSASSSGSGSGSGSGDGASSVSCAAGGGVAGGPAAALLGASSATAGLSPAGSGVLTAAGTYAPLRPSPLIQSHTLTVNSDSSPPPLPHPHSSTGSSSTDSLGSRSTAAGGFEDTGLYMGRLAKARGGHEAAGGGSGSSGSAGGHGADISLNDGTSGRASGSGGSGVMDPGPSRYRFPSPSQQMLAVPQSPVQSGKRRQLSASALPSRTQALHNLELDGASSSSSSTAMPSSQHVASDGFGADPWRASALVDSDDSDDEQMADISSSSLSDIPHSRAAAQARRRAAKAAATAAGFAPGMQGSPLWDVGSNVSSPSSSTPSSPVRLGRARLRTLPLPALGTGGGGRNEFGGVDSNDADMLSAALSNIGTTSRDAAPRGELESSTELKAGAHDGHVSSSLPRVDTQPFGWPTEAGASSSKMHNADDLARAEGTSTSAFSSLNSTLSPSPSSTTTATSDLSRRSSLGDISSPPAAVSSSVETGSATSIRRDSSAGASLGGDATMEQAFGQVSLTSPVAGPDASSSHRPALAHEDTSTDSAASTVTSTVMHEMETQEGSTPRSRTIGLPALSGRSTLAEAHTSHMSSGSAAASRTDSSASTQSSSGSSTAASSMMLASSAQASSFARPSSPLLMAVPPRPIPRGTGLSTYAGLGAGGVAVKVGGAGAGPAGAAVSGATSAGLGPTPVTQPAKWWT